MARTEPPSSARRPRVGAEAPDGPEDLLDAVFREALALPPENRDAYLSRRLSGNPELDRVVRALLEEHAAAGSNGGLVVEVPASGALPAGDGDGDGPRGEVASAGARYRILDVLGEGGMGVVFLAEQLAPIRRRVALKVVKVGVRARADLARFSSERQALALMSHPNIARVYEAGATSDGRLCFAMEHVPGKGLLDYCDDSRLTVRERVALFIPVCHAVQHAHQNGIIHRDLKPANVLVQTDGREPTPKLIDFGLAKFIHGTLGERSVLTQKGLLVGSLEYMSPEQAMPEKYDVDTRTDIYSLGVVLHELLTGLRPAPARSDDAGALEGIERIWKGEEFQLASRRVAESDDRMREHARRRATDPAGLARQLRGDLDWIVARAVERDRVRRYASASELAGDLERYLRNEPVLAGPPGTRYRLSRFARRHRGLIVAAGATLLTLLTGLVAITGLYLENRRARDLLERQRRHVQISADAYQLEHLIRQADEIVPGHPGQVPALEAWIRQAESTVFDRLPDHRARLAELRSRREPPAGGRAGPAESPIGEEALDEEILAELVPKLEWFAGPNGTLGDVRARLAFARRVHRESIESRRREWDAAIASIADPRQCPRYGGLRIPPQLGLVPIGRDPESGLWEFAHLQSGPPAARDAAGRLRMTDSSGIVLILLPGGRFFMGAAPDRGRLPPGAGNLDPFARADESPVHEVALDPFFISKFEMTQGQWQRVTHENRSECAAGTRPANMSYLHSLRHPVERVNHARATQVAARLGLVLPTEAQWEYAARAGTMTPAYWGAPWAMRGNGNGADLASRSSRWRDWEYAMWDDGYAKSAPVGSFRPNRFGLHDVLGNVGEWCRDVYSPVAYSAPIRDGEGNRSIPDPEDYPHFTSRGAAWDVNPARARVTWRLSFPGYSEERLGLRPARRLDR